MEGWSIHMRCGCLAISVIFIWGYQDIWTRRRIGRKRPAKGPETRAKVDFSEQRRDLR